MLSAQLYAGTINEIKQFIISFVDNHRDNTSLDTEGLLYVTLKEFTFN